MSLRSVYYDFENRGRANTLNLLREELQLIHRDEPGSYIGEIVKVMEKTKGVGQSPTRRQI